MYQPSIEIDNIDFIRYSSIALDRDDKSASSTLLVLQALVIWYFISEAINVALPIERFGMVPMTAKYSMK